MPVVFQLSLCAQDSHHRVIDYCIERCKFHPVSVIVNSFVVLVVLATHVALMQKPM